MNPAVVAIRLCIFSAYSVNARVVLLDGGVVLLVVLGMLGGVACLACLKQFHTNCSYLQQLHQNFLRLNPVDESTKSTKVSLPISKYTNLDIPRCYTVSASRQQGGKLSCLVAPLS
jgi:hypothetical protein